MVLYREHQQKVGRGDIRMMAVLIVLYGLQLANAVVLDRTPRDASAIANEGGLIILFFMFGIARSWQLVGARSVSLATAVTAVIQRPSPGGAELGVAADEKPAAGDQ